MNADEDLVHATPQKLGNCAHQAMDEKTYSSRKDEITALSVYSHELGIIGKIDLYKQKEKRLIERKYKLENIYQGQLYQLWAQYFCMIEMGYKIESMAFYVVLTHKTIEVRIPKDEEKRELMTFIHRFRDFSLEDHKMNINMNKCLHCIYCNLCDKIEGENVYT